MTNAPADADVLDDRAWFAAHPHRSHRLRCAHLSEHISPPDAWVVVRQWKPGVRTLIAVALCNEFREIIVTTYAAENVWEELARAVFDTLIDADISGTDTVSRQTFASRLNLLAMGGVLEDFRSHLLSRPGGQGKERGKSHH